ncbi:MAG: hypothetical protein IK067_02030, partial [Prevotella sp.]|nr:hypothetical protein [Prevotella sp.]
FHDNSRIAWRGYFRGLWAAEYEEKRREVNHRSLTEGKHREVKGKREVNQQKILLSELLNS